MAPKKKPAQSLSGVRGELALIALIRSRAARVSGRDLITGIGDDCAVLRVRPGEELVVTTDFSLEGRHFRRDWHSAASIGHRILARGLSDIAAMGARPVAAFLSLALPRSATGDKHWLDGLLNGLMELAAKHGVPLAGGDTSEAPGEEVLADIVVLGACPAGKAMLRSGARPGDLLYVTGAQGGAAAELAALGRFPKKFRRARVSDAHPHLFPQPRLAVGQALLRRGLATACMDVSDGLSTDLAHLCEAAHVSAVVESEALPLHALALQLSPEEAMAEALHGGEDYELLFTARPETKMPRSLAGVAVTRIGTITATGARGPKVMLKTSEGREVQLKRGGWEHFG